MSKHSEISKNIFEQLDAEFAKAMDMLNTMFTVPSKLGTIKLPYYYGYQIIVGPDGKAHLSEFGNLGSPPKLYNQNKLREPLVETLVDKKQNTFVITAEMPGLTKEDIKVNFLDGKVTIGADKGEKKYRTELPVDHELDEESVKATYTNGILELKFKLKPLTKQKTKEVKIE